MIKTDQGGTEDGWRVEPHQDGVGDHGMNPRRDAVVEGGVIGVEHATAEHHLDVGVGDPKSGRRRRDEGHDLIGQVIGGAAGGSIARCGRCEEDRGEFEEPPVVELAGVDGTEDGFGIRHGEVGGYGGFEHRWFPPAIS